MTSSSTPARRPLPALLLALLFAAVAVVVPATSAHAHDQLVSTDPAAGTTVGALPAQITLTFSAELLGEGAGATEVQVTDAAGTSLADGAPLVDGTAVIQTLVGDAEGAIQVLWRVVSSDGHPISGEFAFTVAGTTPVPTPSAAASESPSASPTPSARPESSTTPVPAPVDEEPAASPLPWIILVVVLAAAAAVVAYLLVSRARRRPSAPGSGTPPER